MVSCCHGFGNCYLRRYHGTAWHDGMDATSGSKGRRSIYRVFGCFICRWDHFCFRFNNRISSTIIPLGVPIITDPTISTMGVISSLSISSSIVDLSPFSTVGAMFLANVQGISERKFFKQLLVTAGIFVLLGPLISWLIFVVIGLTFYLRLV